MAKETIPLRPLHTFLPPVPRLQECLEQAPARYLANLPTAGRIASCPDILRFLLDQQNFLALLKRLDLAAQVAFRLVALSHAGRGIPVEQCWNQVAELTGHRPRRSEAILDELRRQGLVFLGHRNYRTVYFVPADLRQIAVRSLLRPWLVALCLPPEELRPAPLPATAVRDLHLLLSAITKGEISLTQSGAIYRRQQLRLAKLLNWPLSPDGEAGPEPRDLITARFAQLWHYGCSRRLLDSQSSVARPGPQIRKWLGLPWARKWLDMAEVTLEHAATWHDDAFTILELLLWAPPDHWLPLDRALCPTSANPLARQALLASARRFLLHLAYLGLVEAAQPQDPCPFAFRLTPVGREYLHALYQGRTELPAGLLPEEETSFLVAPNFEAIAGSTLQGQLLLLLDLVADLARADQALIFQLNRSSVYRALKTGLTADQILSFLSRHSRHPLPENVATSIREWAANYGQVWFARFALLRCAEPSLAARLKASPRLAPFLAGELTPQDLILVDPETIPAVRHLLEKEGYLPRAGIETALPTGAGEPASAPPAPQKKTRFRSSGSPPPPPPPWSQAHPPVEPVRLAKIDWPDLSGRRR